MRETTDKTNTVKLLVNYCPLENIPEQLGWGHEKEIFALALYFKKLSSKHQELTVVESGLVINQKWLFLGASQIVFAFVNVMGKH